MIRLLIVEDSPVSSALLDHIFDGDPDISVIGTVPTADDALKFLEKDMPDVITMDIHLPDMDGYEATRRIMNEHPVPVVVVTATVPREDVAGYFRAIDSGAVAVLQKPVGINGAGYARCVDKLVGAVKDVARIQVGYRTVGAW